MEIAVIGGGSYGTSLAHLLAHRGHHVQLWCRRQELADNIASSRENATYLPGFRLPDGVEITTDLAAAVTDKRLVLAVTPSHAARTVLSEAAAHLHPDVVLVNASKGLEQGSLDRIDQIYAEIFPAKIAARAAYLSGPTFAKELAQRLPSAIVVASSDPNSAAFVQREFSTDRFRVYSSDDVVGVQLGGALKNVVAIAAGMSDGLGLGLNARAALMTRGLAEISRIGVQQGANPLTFAGLSGMGDLVLTCAGELSRNRRVGLALGRGQQLEEIISEMQMVAEGVKTARVAYELTQLVSVEAPIMETMNAVLYGGMSASEALGLLMGRALKSERD